jgi:hypothetical protein
MLVALIGSALFWRGGAKPEGHHSKSEEYRLRAAECQKVADGWPDLIKQQYEELAHQWLMLAEQAEKKLQPGCGGRFGQHQESGRLQ